MARRCKPLPEDRGRAAVEVLRRIYEGDFDALIFDSGMTVECIDDEIAAFIRKFGPFSHPLRYPQKPS